MRYQIRPVFRLGVFVGTILLAASVVVAPCFKLAGQEAGQADLGFGSEDEPPVQDPAPATSNAGPNAEQPDDAAAQPSVDFGELSTDIEAPRAGPQAGDAGDAIPPSAMNLVKRAKEFLAAGKKREALSRYIRAANDAPDYFEANLEAGRLAIELQEFNVAAQALTQAVRTDDGDNADTPEKRNPEVHLLLATALNKIGQFNEAMDQLAVHQEIIGKEDDADTLHQMGLAYAGTNQKEEALESLNKAIELSPNVKEFHFDLGIVYYNNEQEEESLAPFGRSIELSKKEDEYLDPYRARSASYIRIAKKNLNSPDARSLLQSAIQDAQAALAIKSDDAGSKYNEALAHRFLGNRDEAVKLFTEVLGQALNPQSPNPQLAAEVYLRRGIVWFNSGEIDLAEGDFKDGLTQVAEDVRLHLWHGLALAKQGRQGEAVYAYTSALAVNPNYEQAYLNRGLAYLHLDEPAKAVQDLNNYVRIRPEDSSGYLYRSYALMKLGKRQAASEAFRRAQNLNPGIASTRVGQRLSAAGL